MLCKDDVDHNRKKNNSKGMQTKVYEYNFTNNCNKTKQEKKENSATHSKQNLESADSCKPLPLVVLLIERFFVFFSHAPLAHTELHPLQRLLFS